jgi:hypothetical protein
MYERRSSTGTSLPSWLLDAQMVYVKRHVRPNKNDPLGDKAQIIQLNPQYAIVRFANGRETSVSLRDLSPLPQPSVSPELTLEENESEEITVHNEVPQVGENEIIIPDNEVHLPPIRHSNRLSRAPQRLDL